MAGSMISGLQTNTINSHLILANCRHCDAWWRPYFDDWTKAHLFYWPVCGANDENIFLWAHPVHLRQQLVDDSVSSATWWIRKRVLYTCWSHGQHACTIRNFLRNLSKYGWNHLCTYHHHQHCLLGPLQWNPVHQRTAHMEQLIVPADYMINVTW